MSRFYPFFALSMALFTACSTEVISDFSATFCEDFAEGTIRYHNGEYKAQFCDKRDGKKYVYVTIGYQTWMAENLNYRAAGSKCYDNDESNCTEYGRLYSWATAKSACPSGWYLPSDAEWDVLVNYAGGSSGAGKKLKATSGWGHSSYYDNYGGTDNYDFSALPGGYGTSNGYFSYVGSYGYWWSASEYYYSDYAYNRYMGYYNSNVDKDYHSKGFLLSVRCVRD